MFSRAFFETTLFAAIKWKKIVSGKVLQDIQTQHDFHEVYFLINKLCLVIHLLCQGIGISHQRAFKLWAIFHPFKYSTVTRNLLQKAEKNWKT